MRYESADYASASERLHEAELFERLHPGVILTLTEWNRACTPPVLHSILRQEALRMLDDPKMTKIVGTGCKPGLNGVDFVMHRGSWFVPAEALVDEDDANKEAHDRIGDNREALGLPRVFHGE